MKETRTSALEDGITIFARADHERERTPEPLRKDVLAQLDCMEKMLAAQDARVVALRPRQIAFAPRERLPSRPPSEGNAKATYPPFSGQNRPKWPESPHFQAVRAKDEGKTRQLVV